MKTEGQEEEEEEEHRQKLEEGQCLVKRVR